jgi:hypothetical protein
MNIPGGLAVYNNCVYVGFWSGKVVNWMVPEDEVYEWRHEAGVQALEAVSDCLYVVGLDGKLSIPQDDRFTELGKLGQTTHLLKAYPGCLVAVGEDRLYHFATNTRKISSQLLPFADPSAVLGDIDRPVVIDARGRGLRFDAALVYRARFHTTAGAVPTSADDAGRYCVFSNPDGSRTLMLDDRTVFTHLGGTLAVAPGGNYFAVGDGQVVRILNAADLRSLVEDRNRA